MDEIADAIMRLRLAFQRQGLNAPISLELGSNEDVSRLRAMARPHVRQAFRPSMERDKPEIVGEIAGMKVRAPATWMPLRGGGFVAQ